jgi:RNA polymerase sigma factor (sigma-70 family)
MRHFTFRDVTGSRGRELGLHYPELSRWHGMLFREVHLLERFREGDETALELVYSQCVDVVTRIAHAVLRACSAGSARGQGEIAAALADVVQEVFVKAFAPEARRRFDATRPYRPYLARIARNVAVDHWREMRRYVPSDLDVLITRMSLQVNCDTGSGQHDSADPETLEVIDRYIASLDEESRRIHEALYVKGLSQREAARMLRVGRQVVRTKEAKLRRGLRQELSRGSPS